MTASYIMALDAGTTSERAVLFDREGNLIAQVQRPISQIYPQAAWVEHDPSELLSVQLGVMTELQFKTGIHSQDIAALGITNQRETTILWDKSTGEPVYNAIVWQCRRTASFLETLQKTYPELKEQVRAKTGLVLDPYFSASKIRWILDEVPRARQLMKEGKLAFGTVDSWLMYKLTGGEVHATDYTNASRTMLFNIHNLDWDDELLEIFQIDRSILPEVKGSLAYYGSTSSEVSRHPIKIWGVAGDQQASLFGHCAFDLGDAKNTYGTGCFILVNTADKMVSSSQGLLTTLAISPTGSVAYALEGSVFIAGAALQWLSEELRILDDPKEASAMAASLNSNDGVYMVPAFTGMGAPYWSPEARGLICGITRATKREHIVRAALESLAYQSADVLEAMLAELKSLDPSFDLSSLSVDGGVSRNEFCMQFQSDILDKPIKRPRYKETTALGAAYLAGLGCGLWKDADQLKKMHKIEASYTPQMSVIQRQELKAAWRKAVSRTLL